MRSVQEVQSAFMRMDVNGDGSLTKREMLAADEFTPEEVGHILKLIRLLQMILRSSFFSHSLLLRRLVGGWFGQGLVINSIHSGHET